VAAGARVLVAGSANLQQYQRRQGRYPSLGSSPWQHMHETHHKQKAGRKSPAVCSDSELDALKRFFWAVLMQPSHIYTRSSTPFSHQLDPLRLTFPGCALYDASVAHVVSKCGPLPPNMDHLPFGYPPAACFKPEQMVTGARKTRSQQS